MASECKNLCKDDDVTWCDLPGSDCTCAGNATKCSLNDQAVVVALSREKKVTLHEMAEHIRRKAMKDAM
jgi:hypothetical protein